MRYTSLFKRTILIPLSSSISYLKTRNRVPLSPWPSVHVFVRIVHGHVGQLVFVWVRPQVSDSFVSWSAPRCRNSSLSSGRPRRESRTGAHLRRRRGQPRSLGPRSHHVDRSVTNWRLCGGVVDVRVSQASPTVSLWTKRGHGARAIAAGRADTFPATLFGRKTARGGGELEWLEFRRR